MQTKHFLDEPGLGGDLTDPKSPLRVVIAYHDLAAGKRAMEVVGRFGKGEGDGSMFQVSPWPFSLLAEADWCNVAANEALNADILVITTHCAGPLPLPVGRWAEAVIGRKKGTVAAVVALFGPEENPDGAGSSRLEAIQRAARQAELDFFAPAPRRPSPVQRSIGVTH